MQDLTMYRLYAIVDVAEGTLYKGGMKTLKSNLLVLVAQKSQRENRRISLRKVAEETTLQRYTVYAFANNTLREYPKDALEKLCGYFDCQLGDLLVLEEEVAV